MHAAARHRINVITIGETHCNEKLSYPFISNQGHNRLTERTCFTWDSCFFGGVKPPFSETIHERVSLLQHCTQLVTPRITVPVSGEGIIVSELEQYLSLSP